MIKSLFIEGFQSHKETGIDFDKGLNVIVGQSDQGKSSIVRALKWLALNRPQGDSFRNTDLESSNNVTVSVECDDNLITRLKGKGSNSYFIDGEEMKALRTDVPEEISDVLRIYSNNIQSQHPNDQYFLLSDSPGQVAKKFNEVSNMSIMDKAFTEINSQIRSVNQELKHTEKDILDLQDRMKSILWAVKARKSCQVLVDREKEIEDAEYKHVNLVGITNNIIDIKEELSEYDDVEDALTVICFLTKLHEEYSKLLLEKSTLAQLHFEYTSLESSTFFLFEVPQALAEINRIEALKNKLSKKQDDFDNMSELIFLIKMIEKEINTYDRIDKALTSVKTIEKRFQVLKEKRREMDRLESIHADHTNINYEKERIEKDIIDIEQMVGETLENTICPLCGREP